LRKEAAGMDREAFKYKLLYFVRFFADALFYPFMSLYFIQKGVSEANLGLLLAITPILTILVNPIWNYFVKDMKISRIVMQIMTVVEGTMIFLLTKVDTIEAYAIIIGLIAVICSPYIQVEDGFAATYANSHNLEYSSIRIWASVTYVIATLIGGYLGVFIGYDLMFLISGVIFALTSLIILWIRPIEKSDEEVVRPKRDLKSLLRNAEFYKYLIFYTLVIGSVRIGDTFFGVYLMEDFGMTTIEYGWLYAAFVTFEVLSMRFMMVKGSHVSDKLAFIIAGSTFVLRFFVYTFATSMPVLFAITLLRGVGWGIILYAHIKFIIKIVRVENVTAAILIVTLLFSIYTGIGNWISGSFIEQYGYPKLYLINMLLILVGLLVFIVFTPRTSRLDEEKMEETNHAEGL
jgi:predicted MFS family arabinose efflux permease